MGDDKYIIEAAGVVKVDGIGSLFWVETRCGKRAEFYIEHNDYRKQATGGKALSILVSACGMTTVDDSSEFIGKEVHTIAWEEVAQAMLTTPQSSRPKKTNAVIEAPDRRQKRGRFIYVMSCQDSEEPLCKIGIANSPEKRLLQLSTGSPHALRLELARHCIDARAVEVAAHSYFGDRRQNGEWFAITTDAAIDYIMSATRKTA